MEFQRYAAFRKCKLRSRVNKKTIRNSLRIRAARMVLHLRLTTITGQLKKQLNDKLMQ